MLRVGIVGAGLRGRMHARALRDAPDVELVGIADPEPAAAERAAGDLEMRTYSSHAELYARERPDAVIIATPDFAHRDPAVDAARAGMHLLIEKPLATTIEDALAICDAVREGGVQCLVAFENRWNSAFVRAREAIESGAVGEVLSQTAVLSNTLAVPLRMLPWAGRSGPGWFLLPHTADLALWLSGRRPVSVYAAGLRRELRSRGIDAWDLIHALVTFEDGTSASLESAWILPEALPSVVHFRYQILGSRGALWVDQSDHGLRVAGERVESPNALALDVAGRPEGFTAWMVRDWARRLLRDEPLEPGAEQGLRVTRLVAAIHESLENGRPTELAAMGE